MIAEKCNFPLCSLSCHCTHTDTVSETGGCVEQQLLYADVNSCKQLSSFVSMHQHTLLHVLVLSHAKLHYLCWKASLYVCA